MVEITARYFDDILPNHLAMRQRMWEKNMLIKRLRKAGLSHGPISRKFDDRVTYSDFSWLNDVTSPLEYYFAEPSFVDLDKIKLNRVVRQILTHPELFQAAVERGRYAHEAVKRWNENWRRRRRK